MRPALPGLLVAAHAQLAGTGGGAPVDTAPVISRPVRARRRILLVPGHDAALAAFPAETHWPPRRLMRSGVIAGSTLIRAVAEKVRTI